MLELIIRNVMQNNDNLISLSIIRSLQDMELGSFKVMCIILFLVKMSTKLVNLRKER